MTLLSAVLAMTLLSITTAALLTLGASEPQIANNLLRGSQAFYLAESGLEIALAHLNNGGSPLLVQAGAVGAGTYEVTVTPIGLPLPVLVQVRSVGQVGPATRVVSNVFVWDPLDSRWRVLPEFREESGQ